MVVFSQVIRVGKNTEGNKQRQKMAGKIQTQRKEEILNARL